jgi:transposase
MSAPKYVRPLSAEEATQIEKLIRQGGDARVVRRAQMIRLSAKKRKCREIAELLGFTVPTVHRTIDAFNECGVKGLRDRPRSGRPRKATDKYIECLKEAVASSPLDFGYVFTSWTLPRLREHLARKYGVVLHPDYLGRLMSRHGIVYRRPRHVMGHLSDPEEYEEKKEFLDFLKKRRSMRAVGSTSSSSMSVRFISTRP